MGIARVPPPAGPLTAHDRVYADDSFGDRVVPMERVSHAG